MTITKIISGDTHIVEPPDLYTSHLFAVFQEDEATVDLRHRIGIENLLWGNDFPHSEST
ncbi:MAG: hypothetical protein HYZ50_19930 [Deltaproteobacteria bacterium]|nr:hypothetical protein [Deltaproteobacteria bacterium]